VNNNLNLDNLSENANIYVKIFTFNETLKCIRNAHIKDINYLEPQEYRCWGTTSLFDSIIEVLQDSSDNSIVIIATDGADTSSTQYSEEQCIQEIKSAQSDRNITIFYIAEGEEAATQGSSLDLHDNCIMSQGSLSQSLSSDLFKIKLTDSLNI